jgi:hypothetical protein
LTARNIEIFCGAGNACNRRITYERIRSNMHSPIFYCSDRKKKHQCGINKGIKCVHCNEIVKWKDLVQQNYYCNCGAPLICIVTNSFGGIAHGRPNARNNNSNSIPLYCSVKLCGNYVRWYSNTCVNHNYLKKPRGKNWYPWYEIFCCYCEGIIENRNYTFNYSIWQCRYCRTKWHGGIVSEWGVMLH